MSLPDVKSNVFLKILLHCIFSRLCHYFRHWEENETKCPRDAGNRSLHRMSKI